MLPPELLLLVVVLFIIGCLMVRPIPAGLLAA